MTAWFVHGWAFGPAMWRPLADLLPGVSPLFADRGYFGEADFSTPREPAVWITHSLGTMLALHLVDENCKALVAINGFDRFSAAGDGAGIARRVLDRMLTRFDQNSAAVIAEFRARCGADDADAPGDWGRLRGDLVALRDMDCRAQAANITVPVLSLQAQRDPILTPAMRGSTLRGIRHAGHRSHASAGHLLPVQDPHWCASEIVPFLAEVR